MAVEGLASRRCCATSKPSPSGRPTSSTAAAKRCAFTASRAARTPAACVTAKPSPPRRLESVPATFGSSSTSSRGMALMPVPRSAVRGEGQRDDESTALGVGELHAAAHAFHQHAHQVQADAGATRAVAALEKLAQARGIAVMAAAVVAHPNLYAVPAAQRLHVDADGLAIAVALCVFHQVAQDQLQG